jgi:hypothetical protein
MSTTRPAELTAIQRAARTVNETLAREARFPELDNYITREDDRTVATSGPIDC